MIGDIQPCKRKCVYNDHIYEVSLPFITAANSGNNTSSTPFVFENPYFPINQTNIINDMEPSSFHLAEMFDESASGEDDEDDVRSRMSSVSLPTTIRNIAGTIYSDMSVSPNRESKVLNTIGTGRRQNSIRDYFSRDFNSPNRSIVSNSYEDSAMQIVEPLVGNCTCRVCGKIPAESGTYHNCMHCTRSICVPLCSSVCESCGMIFCRFCTTINYSLNYERIICPDCH